MPKGGCRYHRGKSTAARNPVTKPGYYHEGRYRGGKNGAVFTAGYAINLDIESALPDLATMRLTLVSYEFNRDEVYNPG